MRELTTGTENTVVGAEACVSMTTGDGNTIVGAEAFSGANGAESGNTIIGSSAGTSIDNGNQNTIIGASSNVSAATAANEASIGYAVTPPAGGNSVTLGNASVTAVYMASDKGATVHCAAVTEGSSLEIKKNISEIESPLDKITKLRGIEFDYKETDEHSIGMVAEEVNEIFPELVSKDEDGKVTAMSYSRMTAVLLEAVKELSQEVKELKMNNIYNNKERD